MIIQDIKYALRLMAKKKGFTLVAVLTLALGIGANSAIFSVVSAVLITPLPFREPDRVVKIWETFSPQPGVQIQGSASIPSLKDWSELNKSFEQIACFQNTTVNLSATETPERVNAAAAGVYSVMSYTVTQSTREIGIRMALGASRGRVLGIVMRRGVTLAVIGVAIGLGTALSLNGVVETLLFGVKSYDPLTFGSVAISICLVAVLACAIPALRATRVDPIEALRCE